MNYGGWLGKFVQYFLFQGGIQLVNIVSTLFIMRTLSRADFAIYTLTVSLIAAVNVIGTSGITSATMALEGTLSANPEALHVVERTSIRVLRLSLLAVVPVCVTVEAYLLSGKTAVTDILIACTFLALTSVVQGHNAIQVVRPRIEARISKLRVNDLIGSGCRISVLFALLPLGFGDGAALLATVFGFVAQNRYLARIVAMRAPEPQRDPDIEREIWRVHKRQVPNAIYGAFSGQLGVWLLAIFGNATELADFGAIGRLSALFLILSTTIDALVYPAFARATTSRRAAEIYISVMAAYALLGSSLVAVALLVPDLLLIILGPKYEHLMGVLPLAVLGGVCTSFAAALWNMNMSRSWVARWPFVVFGALAMQAGAAAVFGASEVHSVLLVGLAVTIYGLTVSLGTGVLEIRKMWRSEQSSAP